MFRHHLLLYKLRFKLMIKLKNKLKCLMKKEIKLENLTYFVILICIKKTGNNPLYLRKQ